MVSRESKLLLNRVRNRDRTVKQKQQPYQILVVDDHEIILNGTIEALHKEYTKAKIDIALTVDEAWQQIESLQPDLLILDLAIPETEGVTAEINKGIELLKCVMSRNPFLNLVVLSSYTKALVRIKAEIEAHQGGFTVADKTSIQDLMKKVSWSLDAISYTKDVKELDSEELKLEWYRVLKLGSRGLTDREIAREMKVAERTVWSYWHKIRDVFGIYPTPGERHERKKIQTLVKARELGFLD